MIVAFYSAASRTGKDTAAMFMAEYLSVHHVDVKRIAFAWYMKRVCARALGLTGTDDEQVDQINEIKTEGQVLSRFKYPDQAGPPRGRLISEIDGRDFIIGLAEGIRALDEDFWIRHALDHSRRSSYTLVTDMRFKREAEAVKERGGLVVEVVRKSGEMFNEDRLPAGWIDHTIVNDGSLEDLRKCTEVVGRAVMREKLARW